MGSARREELPEGWRGSHLILGLLGDKDPAALLDTLAPLAGKLTLTRARHPRAVDPAALATDGALAGRGAHVVPGVAEAVRQALAAAGPDDLIVATGSLFVAAEARAALGHESEP